uniref:Uncharacterized protein n=1 Tax=Lepeophtheirus salmonis TaxID=72036 RepID=A0A0K2TRA3_LEPSM
MSSCSLVHMYSFLLDNKGLNVTDKLAISFENPLI